MSPAKSPSLLILDLGTSTIKAILTDLTFTDMSVFFHPMPDSHSTDTFTLTSNFDPADLWQITSNLIAQCVKRAELGNLAIAALGITSQRQGVVFLDKAGSELYMAPNLDLRAFFEGAAIDENHAEDIYATTGHLPSFLFTPAKLQFFKRQHPKLYQQISTVMTLGDWVAYKLTGELACCDQLANEAGLTDLFTQQWAFNLLDMLGLGCDFLPRLTRPGELTGCVTEMAGQLTGLPQGTPVTVAGADSQCALIGMNVINPGETGIIAGWSVTTQMVTDRPIFDTERRTWAGQHLLEGRWVLEANSGDAGNVYSWVRDLLFENSPDGFSKMNQLALSVPRGADDTLAHLGPSVSSLSKPTLQRGGFLFPVPFTLTPFHRGNFVRATIENIAFSIREACELLETVSGQSLARLALGGGMTQTDAFPKILTDVLGRPIILANTTHATALGAAIIVAPLIPTFPSSGAEVFNRVPPGKLIEPDPLGVAEYQDHYSRWIRSAKQLKSLD